VRLLSQIKDCAQVIQLYLGNCEMQRETE